MDNKNSSSIENNNNDNVLPICDIGVSYLGLKNEEPPSHYELLKNSINGNDGNLSKHGQRKTYLFYRRTKKNEKPITAIALISPESGEEVYNVIYSVYYILYYYTILLMYIIISIVTM